MEGVIASRKAVFSSVHRKVTLWMMFLSALGYIYLPAHMMAPVSSDNYDFSEDEQMAQGGDHRGVVVGTEDGRVITCDDDGALAACDEGVAEGARTASNRFHASFGMPRRHASCTAPPRREPLAKRQMLSNAAHYQRVPRSARIQDNEESVLGNESRTSDLFASDLDVLITLSEDD